MPTFKVRCSGKLHRIIVDAGEGILAFPDHDFKSEELAAALAGRRPWSRCRSIRDKVARQTTFESRDISNRSFRHELNAFVHRAREKVQQRKRWNERVPAEVWTQRKGSKLERTHWMICHKVSNALQILWPDHDFQGVAIRNFYGKRFCVNVTRGLYAPIWKRLKKEGDGEWLRLETAELTSPGTFKFFLERRIWCRKPIPLVAFGVTDEHVIAFTLNPKETSLEHVSLVCVDRDQADKLFPRIKRWKPRLKEVKHAGGETASYRQMALFRDCDNVG